MANVPANLKYTREHEWAIMDGANIRVGVTEYAQAQLGDVVYVEVPKKGARVEAGKTFGVVESVKAASDLFSPVSGEVVEANTALETTPETVNQDPYGDGWMIVVKPDNASALDSLMSADEYSAFLKQLEG